VEKYSSSKVASLLRPHPSSPHALQYWLPHSLARPSDGTPVDPYLVEYSALWPGVSTDPRLATFDLLECLPHGALAPARGAARAWRPLRQAEEALTPLHGAGVGSFAALAAVHTKSLYEPLAGLSEALVRLYRLVEGRSAGNLEFSELNL
jgi:hypothetical protein